MNLCGLGCTSKHRSTGSEEECVWRTGEVAEVLVSCHTDPWDWSQSALRWEQNASEEALTKQYPALIIVSTNKNCVNISCGLYKGRLPFPKVVGDSHLQVCNTFSHPSQQQLFHLFIYLSLFIFSFLPPVDGFWKGFHFTGNTSCWFSFLNQNEK